MSMNDGTAPITELELRVMQFLKQQSSPVPMITIKESITTMGSAICATRDLAERGYITVFAHDDGFTKLYFLSQHGHAYLFDLMARANCG